jgi:polyferredoxin
MNCGARFFNLTNPKTLRNTFSLKRNKRRNDAELRKNLMSTILLIILILLLIGALPAWPYSRGWGYYPSGGLGLILIILIILALLHAI